MNRFLLLLAALWVMETRSRQQGRRGLEFLAGLMALTVGLTSAVAQGDEVKTPTEQYAETVLAALDHLEGNLPAISQAAEQVAGDLVRGGRLFASDLPQVPEAHNNFAAEATSRAGGMMMTRYARYGTTRLGVKDVLLVDDLGLDSELRQQHMQEAQGQGARVVFFGSAASPLSARADMVISTGLPTGAVPAVKIDGLAEPICPAGPAANVAALWVFTGELVAACTRQGRMPTMFKSVFAPGAQEWNGQYQGASFHSDLLVDPVPAGQLGRAYLAEMRRCVQGLRQQSASFQAGGQMAAGVLRGGGRAWVAVVGHYLTGLFGLPGDPGVLDPSLKWNAPGGSGIEVAQLRQEIGPKDALVYVGYYAYPPWSDWQAFRDSGCPSVWITGGREDSSLYTQPRDWEIHIDPLWTFGDACVTVPGYSIKILPPSGVVQTAALWMITGEVEKAVLQGPSTAVETRPESAAPRACRLWPSFPNPFNTQAVIPYELSEGGPLELTVYDLAGRPVRRLVQGYLEPGTHAVVWDGRDQRGEEVASGVYLCALRGQRGAVLTRKMLLLK